MSFWTLSNGDVASGSAEDAHFSFRPIPDGTTATALIKDFVLDEATKIYNIYWSINSGEFKGRIIFQKIKCFDPKETIRDRAINMMKRLYLLASLQPTHNNPPCNQDLQIFKGRVFGIKIGEWSMIKEDGSLAEGNNVQEIYAADINFKVETGVRNEAHGVPSALSRNSRVTAPPVDNVDIPF